MPVDRQSLRTRMGIENPRFGSSAVASEARNFVRSNALLVGIRYLTGVDVAGFFVETTVMRYSVSSTRTVKRVFAG